MKATPTMTNEQRKEHDVIIAEARQRLGHDTPRIFLRDSIERLLQVVREQREESEASDER